MKRMKLLLVLCGLVSICFARQNGIKFRSFDNWQSVLAASKNENKPIFVDFFTTWCSPCKKMDKMVFPDSLVGEFFNQNFIAIKVQMDSTIKDGETVRKWYPEIASLQSRYEVDAYPALLFVSSTGEVLNRYNGYQVPSKFIETAKEALRPGQKYVKPGANYFKLIKDFRNGEENGAELVKALFVFHERGNARVNRKLMPYFEGYRRVIDTLTSVTISYLRTRPISSLFTKEILTILGTNGIEAKDPLFKIFYANPSKVDRITGHKNFARQVVDRAIQKEFFSRIPQANGAEYKVAFNWDSLYNVVKLAYNEDYAERAIAAAKNAVIRQTHDFIKEPNYPPYFNGFINLVDRYGLEALLIYEVELLWPNMDIVKGASLENLQRVITDGFLCQDLIPHSFDTKQLSAGISMAKKLVSWANANQAAWYTEWCSTYAALLYKTGNIKKAISVAKKGIAFANKHADIPGLEGSRQKCEIYIEYIKSGKPLWVANKP